MTKAGWATLGVAKSPDSAGAGLFCEALWDEVRLRMDRPELGSESHRVDCSGASAT